MHSVTPDPTVDLMRQDLLRALDEELSRLPEKYRTPVILCYLEGQTNDEAAQQLRCPTGTVVTRLARARKRLRDRLARRGLTLSTGALIALSKTSRAAVVDAALRKKTVEAALQFAVGRVAGGLVTARVASLARGALRVMWITKLKLAGILLAMGLISAGSKALALRGADMASASQQAAAAGERPRDRELPRQQKKNRPANRERSEQASGRHTVKEEINQSFKTGNAPRLVVELYNGGIDIAAGSENRVAAKVTKQAQAETEEAARQALKDIDVKITQEGDTVRITAKRLDPENLKANTGASATVYVPSSANLEVRTSNGSVKLDSGTGAVTVHTANGAVQVQDHRGPLNLHTANGLIGVTGGKGKLDLKTTNGNIFVRAEAAAINAVTTNGSVDFRGTLAVASHSLTTSNGSIAIALPANAQFKLEADTTHGKITSAFGNNHARGQGRLRLETSIGEKPATSIKLHTSNGSIAIKAAD
jgi:DUF4097 and DUF4098 domain-containing protein YvlB